MQISFDSVGQLEGDEAVTTEIVDSYNFVYLALSPGAPGGEALADPTVREAIRKAIDYEGLLDITRRRQRPAPGVADPERLRRQRRPAAAGVGRRTAPASCSPRPASRT